MTRRSAGRLLDLALGLDRLPLTRAALAAGLIDERRAEVIAEELSGLDDTDAAAVEKLIIGAAAGLTTGQLRALVRRAVLSADPKAARRRKEKALGTRGGDVPRDRRDAALAGRDLPPPGAGRRQAPDRAGPGHEAAGQPGTLDILRAGPTCTCCPANPPPPSCTPPEHNPPTPGDAAPGDAAPGDTAPGDTAPGDAAPGDAAPGDVPRASRSPRQHAG